MKNTKPILIGNAFPLSLVRRDVVIAPRRPSEVRRAMRGRRVLSFWGHRNTLAAARAVLGMDITPAASRPALNLDADGFPRLEGYRFDRCWVLSPDYAPGYRPTPGADVPPDAIRGWRVLLLTWPARRRPAAFRAPKHPAARRPSP